MVRERERERETGREEVEKTIRRKEEGEVEDERN